MSIAQAPENQKPVRSFFWNWSSDAARRTNVSVGNAEPPFPATFLQIGVLASHNAGMNLPVEIPKLPERRFRPRIDHLFRVEPLDGSEAFYAHDLSLGGLYVTTHKPRWPGQIIPIRFTVPSFGRAIRATCRVAELDEAPGDGVGISLRFLKLSSEARAAILRYIDRNPVDPSFG